MTLLLGLVITLIAVVTYSAYTTVQVRGLRELQSETIDSNRKDSLQLLRIQNDLNSLALAMRDMVENDEPYPLTAWSAQFDRIRGDLDDAMKKESALAGRTRTQQQQLYLETSVAQFWDSMDRTFQLAAQGKEQEAKLQIRLSLQERVASISNAVARFLVQNNESEEQTAQQIGQIYDRVQRQSYLFLTATLIAIVLTSLYLIQSNRRIFDRLSALSEQRSDLAQKLIATQEATLLHISRELHDEFGQILTAMGSMLSRAGRQAPEGSPLRKDMEEVRDIAQSTLETVRSLSQALHPVTLEEAGLETTIDWYLPVVEHQTGTVINYKKSGNSFPVAGGAAVHIYRILQEALNNVTRHSKSPEAWVRLHFAEDELQLEVEDHGIGFDPRAPRSGIGLVAIRERAELLNGTIEFVTPEPGGTLLRLRVPREKAEADGGQDLSVAGGRS